MIFKTRSEQVCPMIASESHMSLLCNAEGMPKSL
jgi:hypothetical protein